MASIVQYGEGLVRGLGAWQILFITIGGTIGLGFATTSGEVLAISGPGGVLIAFGVVGVVAICVMEGICEMIVLWPISNAMIEFVRVFVDPDLAIVVGITYWYTYAVTLAALIIGSANLLQYWDVSFPLMNVTFALFLLTIFLINSRGIKVFGWIELFGGIIKVLLVITIFIIMMLINAGAVGNAGHIGSTFFNDGVRNNPNVATTHFRSVLVSIPLAIFSYIGVELLTVTAFEARDPGSLKGPAKHIGYIMLAIYLIIIGGFVANIEWFNQYLPFFFSQAHVGLDYAYLGHQPRSFPGSPNSSAAPVIAVIQAGIPKLPGVLIGFLIYSGLSAANTALYVASRTLYGLARDLNQSDDKRVVRFFAKLNTISSTTRIPVWALVLSWVCFACWLPFVHLKSNFTQKELQQTLVAIGSVGCVLVWASQCAAFIRYNRWLSKHREHLIGPHMGRFHRWPRKGFSSYASSIQPLPAYIGLVACLVIVFVLNSVSMFNGDQLLFKALTIYLGPGILLLIFILLKLWNRRSYVKLGNWEALRLTLNNLDSLIESSRVPTPPGNISDPDYNPQNDYNPQPSGFEFPPPAHVNGNLNQNPSNGYGYSGYPPNRVPPQTISPHPGFAMPLTAAQIAAMQQDNPPQQPHHQTSHPSFQYRSESPFGQGQNYELEDRLTSPVSVASEVHSESVDISRMDAVGRAEHERRVSEVSAYASPESRLEPSLYPRPQWGGRS